MTNTKELLQLAARAAGIELVEAYWGSAELDRYILLQKDTGVRWNPATNSGDSRDLQVKLKISLEWLPSQKVWMAWGVDCKGVTTGDDDTNPNMAVLLVAAELGKAMEDV